MNRTNARSKRIVMNRNANKANLTLAT